MRKYPAALSGVLIVLCSGPALLASVVPAYTQAGAMNGYSVSNTDLVESGSPALTSAVAGSFSPYTDGSGASNVAALLDGSDGSATTKSVETAVSTQNTNWTLTITLNTSTNTSGYSISEIDTVSGWTADFANQKYILAYSTVTAPTSFTNVLGTFENDSNVTTGNPAVGLKTALTDSGLGNFATNVAGLKFTFEPDSLRGHQGAYREIDVIGTATPAPEPASVGLLGLASLAMLASRRRGSKWLSPV